jgi:drug/metabolite transporter (DMT)-like permease
VEPPREQTFATGIAFVLLATVGWSLSGIFVRFLPGLTGWEINCWRGLSMSLALVAWLTATYGVRGTIEKFRVIPLPAMVACAGFFALGSTLYVTSLTLTSTANVSAIGAISPLFAATMAPLVTRERASLLTWAAAVMALGGVAVIVHDGLTSGRYIGDLLAVLVALSFAGQTMALRRYRNLELMPAMAAGGFVVFVLAALFGGGLSVPAHEIAVLSLMGPVQLAIPILLYARGARSVPGVTLTIIVMLDVVLNPLWTWIGVGEVPSAESLIGSAIIIGAVALSIAAAQIGRRT